MVLVAVLRLIVMPVEQADVGLFDKIEEKLSDLESDTSFACMSEEYLRKESAGP